MANRTRLAGAAIALALLCLAAPEQMRPQGNAGKVAQAKKEFVFEVLSIHPHKPGTQLLDLQYMPNGYRASVTFDVLLKLALLPGPSYLRSSAKILNAPEWVEHEWYDVEAHVAPEDETAWQQGGSLLDGVESEFLRSAWRAALKERCKLAMHLSPITVPSLNLIVTKKGIRNLTPTVPGATKRIPGKTYKVGDGFYIQGDDARRFAGVSMQELAMVLTRFDRERPVIDQTRIEGRYDFTLPWYSYASTPDNEISSPFDRMPLASIGLILRPGKRQGVTVSIDHIEKPDAN